MTRFPWFRSFPRNLVLTLIAVAAGAAFAFTACSGDCTSSRECTSGEFCYEGLCTPANAQGLGSCLCDEACNGRECGEPAASGEIDQFKCIADRCLLRPPQTVTSTS